MIDIKQALCQAINLLTPTSPSAQIDAEVLLAYTLNTSRTFIYAHPEKILENNQLIAYQEWVTKRREGIPIAYLIGSREFWSLALQISKDTLIPRPETELLVELSLSLLGDRSPVSLLDLGTGSGAIALALASERPDWQILASDISEAALAVAHHNATHLNLSNVRILCSDWFVSLPHQSFNAILSNPPYIAANDPHLQQGDLRFEPQNALISGEDGLDALSHIIQQSQSRLLPGGLLLLEHGFQQKEAVTSLLNKYGYEKVHCWQDGQGLDRVSGGWRKI